MYKHLAHFRKYFAHLMISAKFSCFQRNSCYSARALQSCGSRHESLSHTLDCVHLSFHFNSVRKRRTMKRVFLFVLLVLCTVVPVYAQFTFSSIDFPGGTLT